MRTLLVIIITALMLALPAQAGPLDDDARATEVADMHYQGMGVPQDYAEAAKWYRKAAENGYAPAQIYLGLMHSRGLGGPQDFVQAHMWFKLAASGGYATASEYRDIVANHMTPAQIAEAQKLAREWEAKHRK